MGVIRHRHLAAVLRLAAGLGFVVHGFAHTVFALRGTAGVQPTFAGAHAMLIFYSAALVCFVAGGVGVIGARPFSARRVPLLAVGTFASVLALTLGWQPDLWPGLAADAVLVTWLLVRRVPEPELPRAGRRVAARMFDALAALLVIYVAAGAILWPWHRTWGTSEGEWKMALPGDSADRNPALELMHGISIDAPAWVVWAWLVQIGQDRAGFYSYDELERLFGVAIENADAINTAWQQRAAGDLVPATQQGYLGGRFGDRPGWRVGHVEPCRALVLENWGAFVVLPEGPDRSRLIVRSRFGGPDAPVAGAAITFLAFELPHFIMERGMLRGIKQRAESPRGQIGASPCLASS